jgi:flavin reductase (DIM6/NTAB) family NADH-FMN oxidoreductase RutF
MHKSIDPANLPPRDVYQLLISTIIPRPIAWISTVSKAGRRNLAPFSFFNGVGGVPPIVAVSIGSRGGIAKDTLRNLQETGECVIQMVTAAQASAMNITSTDWPEDVDEIDMAKLAVIPSDLVRPPRIAAAPIALEGKLLQSVPVAQTGYTLALIRIVRFHIEQNVLRPNGTVDPGKLNPVARLGGSEYALLGDFFTMARPLP